MILSNDKTPTVREVYTALVPPLTGQAPEVLSVAADNGDAVPIRPFLAGQAFEPELIQQMSIAFIKACEALRLEPADDPTTRLVAKTIVELAERGLRDAETLVEMTLREFGTNCDAEQPE